MRRLGDPSETCSARPPKGWAPPSNGGAGGGAVRAGYQPRACQGLLHHALRGLLALLHSWAPAPAPAAARKSAGSLMRHQRGRPRRRRRSGGAPSRRELAPSPLGPVQGPSPPACSAPAVRTARLLKQGGQHPPPLHIPGAGREAPATARTSRKKKKAKRGPGENQPAGRKQARTCMRQRERRGARRTAGRWRTRPPPVPAAPR